MRIFALETSIDKLKKQYISAGEEEVLFTRYHGLSFFFSSLREIILTVVFIGVAITGFIYEWPMVWVGSLLALAWVGFVFFNLIKAYVDWSYDFIMVTTDKVILMDQTSVFRRSCNPIHIENVGSVSAETQYWNVFPFGVVRINLKEGEGGKVIVLKYVPHAENVAAKIADVVTYYQRYVDGGESQRTNQHTVPRMYGQQSQAPAQKESQILPEEEELPSARV